MPKPFPDAPQARPLTCVPCPTCVARALGRAVAIVCGAQLRREIRMGGVDAGVDDAHDRPGPAAQVPRGGKALPVRGTTGTRRRSGGRSRSWRDRSARGASGGAPRARPRPRAGRRPVCAAARKAWCPAGFARSSRPPPERRAGRDAGRDARSRRTRRRAPWPGPTPRRRVRSAPAAPARDRGRRRDRLRAQRPGPARTAPLLPAKGEGSFGLSVQRSHMTEAGRSPLMFHTPEYGHGPRPVSVRPSPRLNRWTVWPARQTADPSGRRPVILRSRWRGCRGCLVETV